MYPPEYESDDEDNDQSEGDDTDDDSRNICEPNTKLKKLYFELSKFVERPLFDGIVTGLILLNTVVLSMYYYGMDEELVFVLDTLNAVSIKTCSLYSIKTNSRYTKPLNSSRKIVALGVLSSRFSFFTFFER